MNRLRITVAAVATAGLAGLAGLRRAEHVKRRADTDGG